MRYMKTRIYKGKKEFQCYICKRWFELDEEWDKEARKECIEIWGCEPDERFNVNCDDCQKVVNPTLLENNERYKDTISKLTTK